MTAKNIKQQLQKLGDPRRAEHSAKFFKTGKGQYAEGDRFIGCSVPQTRSVAKTNTNTPLEELKKLLDDEFHECRFCALIILSDRFKKSEEPIRKEIINFYLANTHRINNWDLVDVSAYAILGEWLLNKKRTLLYQLADSNNLWEERISIIATMAFIRKNDFNDALRIVEKLLTHPHDLIHKACGWMLRETGKRNEKVLTDFLDKYSTQMPRTMLRYAIEKLSHAQKSYYMNIRKQSLPD